MKKNVRDEWKQMELIDHLHTLLAEDNRRAGDIERSLWHIQVRDRYRSALDAAASIAAGHKVTGYKS